MCDVSEGYSTWMGDIVAGICLIKIAALDVLDELFDHDIVLDTQNMSLRRPFRALFACRSPP